MKGVNGDLLSTGTGGRAGSGGRGRAFVKDSGDRVTRRPLNPSLLDSWFPRDRTEGLRFDDFSCLVDEAISHCWEESVYWIRTGLTHASTLASIGGGRHLILRCSVGSVSKSPIRTSGDIGREVCKGNPGIQDGSHRLKLTDRWARVGAALSTGRSKILAW
jgi:hypothetical protein